MDAISRCHGIATTHQESGIFFEPLHIICTNCRPSVQLLEIWLSQQKGITIPHVQLSSSLHVTCNWRHVNTTPHQLLWGPGGVLFQIISNSPWSLVWEAIRESKARTNFAYSSGSPLNLVTKISGSRCLWSLSTSVNLSKTALNLGVPWPFIMSIRPTVRSHKMNRLTSPMNLSRTYLSGDKFWTTGVQSAITMIACCDRGWTDTVTRSACLCR